LRGGAIGKFLIGSDGAEQEGAAAHVTPAGEFDGEKQAFPEDGKKCVGVFSGGDAAEEDDFAGGVGLGEREGGGAQRGGKAEVAGVDRDGGELSEGAGAEEGIGGDKAARGRDDLHAGNARRWSGEVAGVGEFSAEVESAAKSKDGAEFSGFDLDLAGELEGGAGSYEHGGAFAIGPGRREEKDAAHGESMPPSRARAAMRGSATHFGTAIIAMSSRKKVELEVDGRKLQVSNLEKVLYPEVGFTKGEVIDYYIRIAPVLLPHLKNRPITLKRYPEGVEGFFFYEKQCPSHRPDWVETAEVPAQREEGKIDYCLMNDLPALVWAANLADLELHTFLHRAPTITRPTALAFDLDPGAPADMVLCCRVGLWLRAIFDELGLESFPKTSGSKGLQVFVPLNTATTYEKTKAFAHALAQRLEREHPDEVVSRMQKSLRRGKVLIDWSQNDDHKTTVNVYSLRAKAHPTVSTPVTWKEVEAVVKKKTGNGLVFESAEVLKRVKKLGDLFAPVLTLKQKLPGVRKVTA